MSTRNAHWYSRNEGQCYPLDETADTLDTNGKFLPPNILVDLTLRYPIAYGAYPFVSAVTVTPTLITIAIQAVDTLDPPYTFNPLAVLTLQQPVPEGVQSALTALTPGVSAWAVIGSGARDKNYSGRFAGPKNSLLTRRAVRPYRGIPVTGLQRLHAANVLTGVVKLVGDPPIEIVGEDRDIPGVGTRRTVVFRLTTVDATGGFIQPATTVKASNVFKEFAGPCSGRPESQTCGDPQPIEFLNNVGPDCDGVLTLQLKGCVTPIKLGDNGVILDSTTSLTRLCVPPYIPAPDGRLPSEYDPYNFLPIPTTPPPPPTTPPPESEDIVGELPFTECFYLGVATDFTVIQGTWGFHDVTSSGRTEYCDDGSESAVSADSIDTMVLAYASVDPSLRNLTIWEGFDVLCVRRRYIADVKMTNGIYSNAALVLNYREHATTAGLFVYYIVEVDYNSQVFRVSRFNGINVQIVLEQPVPGIAFEHWYRLIAEVIPGPSGGTTSITAKLIGLQDPVTVTIGPLIVSNYYPSTGKPGFTTDQAISQFSFFRIEELP